MASPKPEQVTENIAFTTQKQIENAKNSNDNLSNECVKSGKTLAFLLPAMLHTEYQLIPRSERKGPNVLVLAPTRELALQIEKEVAKYSFRGMKAVCVYGGGDRKAQISNITDGVEIIIATPGRLNDLVEAKVIDVCTITFLILDEGKRDTIFRYRNKFISCFER